MQTILLATTIGTFERFMNLGTFVQYTEGLKVHILFQKSGLWSLFHSKNPDFDSLTRNFWDKIWNFGTLCLYFSLCKLFHFADCGGRLCVYRVHLLWNLHRLHLPSHTLHARVEPHNVPDQHVGRRGNIMDE